MVVFSSVNFAGEVCDSRVALVFGSVPSVVKTTVAGRSVVRVTSTLPLKGPAGGLSEVFAGTGGMISAASGGMTPVSAGSSERKVRPQPASASERSTRLRRVGFMGGGL